MNDRFTWSWCCQHSTFNTFENNFWAIKCFSEHNWWKPFDREYYSAVALRWSAWFVFPLVLLSLKWTQVISLAFHFQSHTLIQALKTLGTQSRKPHLHPSTLSHSDSEPTPEKHGKKTEPDLLAAGMMKCFNSARLHQKFAQWENKFHVWLGEQKWIIFLKSHWPRFTFD